MNYSDYKERRIRNNKHTDIVEKTKLERVKEVIEKAKLKTVINKKIRIMSFI